MEELLELRDANGILSQVWDHVPHLLTGVVRDNLVAKEGWAGAGECDQPTEQTRAQKQARTCVPT